MFFLYSKKIFPFAHWLVTLAMGPVALILLTMLSLPHSVSPDFELIPIYFLFSLLFSVPALIVYFFIVQALKDIISNDILLKVVLNLIVIFAIAITIYVIDGSMAVDFFLAYSIGTVLGSVLLGFK